MGRPCIVCAHKSRKDIDKELVEPNAQYSAIARKYFGSTKQRDALRRHAEGGHIVKKIAKAAESKEIAQADSLLSQVKSLSTRALSILSQAEGTGDLRTACSAIREVRGTLELLLKVSGELKPNQTNVNVAVITHEYRLVKGVDPPVRK